MAHLIYNKLKYSLVWKFEIRYQTVLQGLGEQLGLLTSLVLKKSQLCNPHTKNVYTSNTHDFRCDDEPVGIICWFPSSKPKSFCILNLVGPVLVT